MRRSAVLVFFILFLLPINLWAAGSSAWDNILNVGDKLRIMLPVESSLNIQSASNITTFAKINIANYSVIIDDDGYIVLPSMGTILAKGQTIPELETIIRKKILTQFHVKTNVVIELEYSSRKYGYIFGSIKNPGKYYFMSPFTLFDLLSAAGGLSAYGVVDLMITRRGERITTNNQQNVALNYGDIVFVNPLEKEIYLSGEFRKPGNYVLDYEFVPLQQAIGMGGGLSDKSDGQIQIIPKSGKLGKVILNDESLPTINNIMIRRGDTLVAMRSFWPTLSEVFTAIVAISVLFR